jgi:hypothetical protein
LDPDYESGEIGCTVHCTGLRDELSFVDKEVIPVKAFGKPKRLRMIVKDNIGF